MQNNAFEVTRTAGEQRGNVQNIPDDCEHGFECLHCYRRAHEECRWHFDEEPPCEAKPNDQELIDGIDPALIVG